MVFCTVRSNNALRSTELNRPAVMAFRPSTNSGGGGMLPMGSVGIVIFSSGGLDCSFRDPPSPFSRLANQSYGFASRKKPLPLAGTWLVVGTQLVVVRSGLNSST